ncbi:MAG TPA: MBL fold metallo-hydrolase [Solirubrobacteraceae bacterium]|nr:MBL fold metallo-hydrolase [Solirubrobacteraceae bacterium]
MRVTALLPDVLVFVSDVWQTTCTAVRDGEEGFVVDSPVYPEELRALPEVLGQARFPASGLLATHGDWDHLLGRQAFPGAALGCAQSTAARLTAEPGAAQRRLRAFDAEHYVERPGPLALGSLQALPVPGKLELGAGHEIELHAAEGHTADGAAYWLPWLSLLICGDYLSPVEIPMISAGGSLERYDATLQRLAPIVAGADWVVPGHGAPQSGARAAEILAADRAYLAALASDPEQAALPEDRRSPTQQRIHADNLAALRAG